MEDPMKAITKPLSVVLALALSIALSFVEGMPSLAASQPPPPTPSVQNEIDKLLANYRTALEEELRNGETVDEIDPLEGKITLLAGNSAAKMDALWQETLDQINRLKARPADQRIGAMQLVQSIDGGEVSYLDRDRIPYDMTADLERYSGKRYVYLVDIATGQIIQVALIDQNDYRLDPALSKIELGTKARAFAARIAGSMDLDGLVLSTGDKVGETFFFRWEDQTKTLPSGFHPFLQVGISRAGDLLNIVNTLPFSKVNPDSNDAPLSSQGIEAQPISTFSEVYANGGDYWSWVITTRTYYTVSNAGYCYIAGWCSPKNFYYTTTCHGCTDRKGRWTPNYNPHNANAYAFIPSTHATHKQAAYKVYYNGGSRYQYGYVDQSIWYNTWVRVTTTLRYNITRIDLGNLSDSSTTRKVAWDETWVYTP